MPLIALRLLKERQKEYLTRSPRADLLKHLQDCSNGSLWLVNLNIVAAVFCKHMLAIGG